MAQNAAQLTAMAGPVRANLHVILLENPMLMVVSAMLTLSAPSVTASTTRA